MLILAHRGASGEAPENTMAAFKLAYSQQADGIECDIVQHENQFYILHDRYLDRTTNANGLITTYTHEKLQSLNAGSGQKIPTLEQLIESLPSTCLCNLELKSIHDIEYFCSTVLQLWDRHNLPLKNLLVSSFHHPWLGSIQDFAPTLNIAHLIAHYPNNPQVYFSNLASKTINVAIDFLDNELVDCAHNLNKKIMVYTVNHDEEVLRCKRLGVNGVFTNYPARARQLLSFT